MLHYCVSHVNNSLFGAPFLFEKFFSARYSKIVCTCPLWHITGGLNFACFTAKVQFGKFHTVNATKRPEAACAPAHYRRFRKTVFTNSRISALSALKKRRNQPFWPRESSTAFSLSPTDTSHFQINAPRTQCVPETSNKSYFLGHARHLIRQMTFSSSRNNQSEDKSNVQAVCSFYEQETHVDHTLPCEGNLGHQFNRYSDERNAISSARNCDRMKAANRKNTFFRKQRWLQSDFDRRDDRTRDAVHSICKEYRPEQQFGSQHLDSFAHDGQHSFFHFTAWRI